VGTVELLITHGAHRSAPQEKGIRMTTAKVRFSVVEEFLAELAAEPQAVEDRIVRVTFNYEQSPQAPFVYHLRVVAGFLAHGKLVYLTHACGDVWQGEQNDKGDQAKAKAEHIAQEIEAQVQALTLMVRRGIFELERL
jgi:hypothetical protein